MKKYQIIYADPPWEYDAGRCLAKKSVLSKGGDVPYSYMNLREICSLRVDNITDKNCLLFMWTTGPKLNQAFDVGMSWGFIYSTIGFVWDKVNTNPGYYTLSSAEICLVFKKGKIPLPRGDRNVKQFLQEKKHEHSRKPAEIRRRINQMFPDQNKIELFARKEDTLFELEDWKGWDVWGNEVESDINL